MSLSTSGSTAKRFGVLRSLVIGVLCWGTALSANAGVVTISFLDFFADPPDQITVDASNATLSDGEAAFVVLSNIPGAEGSTDPDVIKASDGARLLFDYVFSLPEGNGDLFHAVVLDGTTGDPIGGSGLELFATTGGAGTGEFDLSGLVGMLLGLQFELVAPVSSPELPLVDVLPASVALSNLRIVTPEPTTSVPTPSTLLLLCSGLAMMMVLRRRV